MSWRKQYVSGKRQYDSGRIKLLALFFVFFAVIILFRLFSLQVVQGGFYTALALGQHELYQKIFPVRGSIYVLESDGSQQKLFPLVTNRDMKMLYAVPYKITEHEKVATQLVEILGIAKESDPKEIERILFADISPELNSQMAQEIKTARLQQWQVEQKEAEIARLTRILSKENDPYEPIRHRLSDEQVEKIVALKVNGLGFRAETWRFYPEESIGGHIFGFYGFDGDKRKGRYGLEGYFDEALSGRYGEIRSEKDVWGNIITVGSSFLTEKVDGADLILTIDRAVQYHACQALYRGVKQYQADGGSVIVMDPQTGVIMAMCGSKDYNPSEYYKVSSIGVYNNPAIFNAYEPGSIFKPITLAAALDIGKIEPTTIYEDTGSLTIGRDTIYNFGRESWGKQTMTQVLEKSINTGTVWSMRQTTPKVFTKYVQDFGFGDLTGIELQGEARGDISNLNRSSEIYAVTASYGQGITATPIQLVSAFSAIANGGKLMKPFMVSQIINDQDEPINFYPQEVRQVISSKTSRILSAMLVSVVENGHGSRAAVSGYRVGGKTGTANVAIQGTSGYSNQVITSFVGFAPFSNPRFVMLVRFDNPQYGKLGANTAAPVFQDIAKFILQYYNIPYDAD